jgi:transcriptional regulator with XRE-family HTH domain
MLKVDYRAKIRQIRKSRGISTVHISRTMGKHDQWLWNVEKGRKKLDADDVIRLAEILNCSIDDIFLT